MLKASSRLNLKTTNIEEYLSDKVTHVRQLIGKINCLVTQTNKQSLIRILMRVICPVISTENIVKSTKQVNRIIKAKKENLNIIISNFGDLHRLQLVAYNDTVFVDVGDDGS